MKGSHVSFSWHRDQQSHSKTNKSLFSCLVSPSILLYVTVWIFVATQVSSFHSNSSFKRHCGYVNYVFSRRISSALYLQKGWLARENQNDDDDHNAEEQTPQVQRKQKKKGGGTFVGSNAAGSSYKPLDNRDQLPFAVQQITPDPYTRPETKRQRQVKQSKPNNKKKSDLLASRLKVSSSTTVDGDNIYTLLGEFQLDKSTTSGDIIGLANGRQYKVETARCQYKYNGQRFVMVRKILEVKELTRAIQERQIQQQWSLSGSKDTND